MTDREIKYRCVKCKRIYPFKKEILTCPYHSPYYGYLTLEYDHGNIKFELQRSSSWEKYLPLLPVKRFSVNFDEQKTPLIFARNLGKLYGISQLYVKDESKNASGSFKDRESICAINQAIEWGIDDVFVVSSGNAAVSTSCYAQKARIPCKCIISKDLSAGKRLLLELYGSILIERLGIYEDLYRWAVDSELGGWNCTPGINPIKEEGVKMIAYEIVEEIDVPDVVVAPCGNGTLLYGIYKGFKELKNMGITQKVPKCVGVQIENASPIKEAIKQGKDFVRVSSVDSVAEGIIAEESFSSPKAILAVRDTGGMIVEVRDDEIRDALQNVTTLESLIPEITSAAVYAALPKLSFGEDEKVVAIQTAGGAKQLSDINLFLNKC